MILVARLPQSAQDLATDILEFGFSFFIVVIVWLAYRRAIVTVPHETQGTLIVTVGLLFCVSIEPFLFYVLVSTSAIQDFASIVYAADVGAMSFLLAALNYLLLTEERSAHPRDAHPALLDRLRLDMFVRVVVGAVFLVSALPVFWIASPVGFTLRIDLWYAALALMFILHRSAVSSANKGAVLRTGR